MQILVLKGDVVDALLMIQESLDANDLYHNEPHSLDNRWALTTHPMSKGNANHMSTIAHNYGVEVEVVDV